jgi:hypothetical protein
MSSAAALEPALSIVVASRNDAHGGNIRKRMLLFMKGLLDQARRHDLRAELVVVDWNPPPDRPPLSDALPAPRTGDRLVVRYVTVPPALHARYRRSGDLPLYQMIAKNVGIRRARGRFVLCTNVDLLFSDALCRFLAATTLRPDTYYRANRCDVPDGVDESWDITRQLAWCEAHVIRRLGRNPAYANINLELVGLRDKGPVKRWIFDKMAIAMQAFWSPEKRAFYQLDTFACGDFTLMSRDAWTAIRGYAELDLYSLHVDSLGLISAAAAGYRQHVLPTNACTYHIDHPSGWEGLSLLDKVRFLERRPALDYGLVHDLGLYALAQRAPLPLNDESWGLADLDLHEVTLVPGMTAAATAPPSVA